MDNNANSNLSKLDHEAMEEAIYLWKKYAKQYQGNSVEVYHDLLAQLKEKKAYPLCPITKTVLNDYPKIDFLKAETEEEAKCLLNVSRSELSWIIISVKGLEDNAIYSLVASWISDAKRKLRNNKKCYGGVNPEAIRVRRRQKQPRSSR